jgi:2-aminoadipate transaminase
MLPDVQFINRPQLIDMTWGHPDPALLPAEAMQQAATTALADGGATALPYGAEQGPGRLIELLCAKMARAEGSAPDPLRVAITGGISQAIDHLCTLLTRPGDIALVEAPTYHLAMRIMVDRGLRLIPVAADDEGVRLDALEETLAMLAARGERPTLLYTIPTFSNPAGATMGLKRRIALTELALAHHFTILEDDAYRDIWFENPPPPTIAALNQEAPVVRLGSFAKCLAPGLRLGWIVAPPAIIEAWRLSGLLDSGGGVNHFTACVVAELLATGELDRLGERLRSAYRIRRDTLVSALQEHLPPGASVASIAGGFFAWVKAPEGIDTVALLPRAEAAGLGYIPGARFFAGGGGNQYLRLSFSRVTLEQLRAGAQLLGKLFV